MGSGLPCDVESLLAARCWACHGTQPVGGAPMSLVTYGDLTAASKSVPGETNAQLAVARMQSLTAPMPPGTSPTVPAREVLSLQSWISAGFPNDGCNAGHPDGGTDGGPDPFSVPPTCTSGITGNGGASPLMNPGRACISCHAGGEGPRFAVAGTLYPSAHEPDMCYGVNGENGARVVIAGADGKVLTLVPNASGNFYYSGVLALPFRAKVTYMGRERAMAAGQTSGDCDACHTQNGALGSPGRILLP
jgi:hypothetical protein